MKNNGNFFQAAIDYERENLVLQQKYLSVLQENLRTMTLSKDVLKEMATAEEKILNLQVNFISPNQRS